MIEKIIPITEARNQSWPQTSSSILSSLKELLTGFSVLPLVLKVNSEATIEIGTTKISRVNQARIRNFGAFSFHHAIISNSSSKLVSSSASEKYSSISDFRGSEIFLLV
jgi:hypothetical protein